MKKINEKQNAGRRFVLHRETLRMLDDQRLADALGGIETTRSNSCPQCCG